MVEPQLVEYIKKARVSGQSDDQSRALLYKNGWTVAEVDGAVASLSQPQVQPQSQSKTQPVSQPKIEAQPKVVSQPAVSPLQSQQSQPQTQPKFSGQVQQSSVSQIKVRSHFVPRLLTALFVIIFLGAIAYFAAGQYLNLPYSNLVWNLFSPNPQTVINKMAANMKNVKSSHILMSGEINVTDDEKVSRAKFLFNVTGDSDIIDANNPKTSMTFGFNLIPTGASTLASANASVIVVGSTLYLKLNDFTDNTFRFSALDVSQIKGKWLKVDRDSVEVLSEAGTGSSGMALDVLQTNNAEFVKKIQDLVLAENILSVEKQLNSEFIGGQDTYHYLVKISKDKIKTLLNELIVLQLQEATKLQKQSGLTTTDGSSLLAQNMMQTFVNTFVEMLGDINIEMWIGKKDYMLYQYKVDKLIDVDFFGTDSMKLQLKLNAANSNFNKPVTIQEPQVSEKIESVLLPILKMQKISSNLGQIGSIAEEVLGVNESYYLLCKNGLLNGYLTNFGTNLIRINNDIVSQGGKKPVCLSDVNDFCVSTQLSDGSYLCVDKDGTVGNTRCLASRTDCDKYWEK